MTTTTEPEARAQAAPAAFVALLDDGRFGVYDRDLTDHGTFDRYEEAFGTLAALTREDLATLEGPEFTIPLLLPEGTESRDGRMAAPGAIYWRDEIGPWPLNWQFADEPAHMGAAPVGTITRFERTPRGVAAVGRLGTWPAATQAAQLIDSGAMHFVSAVVTAAEVTEVPSGPIDPETGIAAKYVAQLDKGEIVGATGVHVPAFAEATISLVAQPDDQMRLPIAASATTATRAPAEWFADPQLPIPTAIWVTEDNRVFGHIALWGECHIGVQGECVYAPRSRSDYSDFLLGEYLTSDGERIPIGTLTADTGHADLHASAKTAAAHYDNTGMGVAFVNAGEDDHGIWVAGVVKPDATEAQVQTLRAAKPSGDWRPIRGGLELVAVLCVNTPGFPVPRYAVTASGALAAMVGLPAPRRTDPGVLPEELRVVFDAQQRRHDADLAALEVRLARAERVTTPLVASALREELDEQVEHDVQEAAPVVLDAVNKVLGLAFREPPDGDWLDGFKAFPAEKRKKMAKAGTAMPDGGFPIESCQDAKNARQALGRTSPGKQAAVKAHIAKMEKQLDCDNGPLPDSGK